MIEINKQQKQFLKQKAHPLKPVVMVGGDGIKATVLQEINQALTHHELIKVKLRSDDRDERLQLTRDIAGRSHSLLVQRIGKIAVFYRPHPKKPVLKLPA